MASIDTLRASDGSGNASVATVQSPRSAMATTLVVDTVQGINDTFHATMGTPHTFVDPVTSETITVISESTAVDFQGHVDGTNLEIDTIAPGYTDAGSSVNDIVIIKPTTQWADEVADVLEVSHEDDGALKEQAVLDALGLNDPANGWSPLGATPNTVTANGNKSYDLVFNGTDLTDTISEGMRIRTARTVAAPTQCATFDGTNDYFSRTSAGITGMTFTDDFSVSAWIKLSNYPAVAGMIASRFNGTSGWGVGINANGQVYAEGFNGGGANYSNLFSYQSVPLNKWVHVVIQLDMSAFTATTTTSYVMIDGVDVPSSVTRAGTNPTSLVQAGNLEIGARNGGTQFFFPGKIAQVAIYSAKVTQATHLAAMNQGLTGSETSLVSAYSLSNDITDLSANNNDLTANGGVLATTADSPFGNSGVSTTIDYGIVMAKSFSTNTTLTVQVPEGCTIPTSGGVSGMYYSINDVPYGFPRDKGKWTISTVNIAGYTAATAATISFKYNITVPIGKWIVGYDMNFSETLSGAGTINARIGLGTTSAATVATSDATATVGAAVSIAEIYPRLSAYMPVNLSAQQVYYLNGTPVGATFTNFGVNGVYGTITADNAYI